MLVRGDTVILPDWPATVGASDALSTANMLVHWSMGLLSANLCPVLIVHVQVQKPQPDEDLPEGHPAKQAT